ncbi:protein mono-ADP-ribosyltransferase PARP14-like isoform X1 [Oxyura jamaicensis]|uniref:protein mono-ADP-ribosyltransferase PARP14-like isoform X1 n=1 Tax=Oxyura jamaicensis TaxID=8884 RepID=UPI0015A67583|nr:protein mono-ADP-ribosyltransferase PARP14-like isoform X1 [Oxyura jamaicensis]
MSGPRAAAAFPLLVRGDWGAGEPSAALRKKLLLYFQSHKRSGGGECELQGGPGHLLVCFANPEVRQRVLDRQGHELDLGSRGRLSLLVTEPPADSDLLQEPGPAEEPGRRAAGAGNEPCASLPTCKNEDASVRFQQEKTETCANLEAETDSRSSVIAVTTAAGEEIEDEVVEMYFENKKKSGGGPIKSWVRKDQLMIITFHNKEDAQEVLQREHHSVKKINLFVKPWQVETTQEPFQVENSEASLCSPLVVLENVQETVKSCMLIMLVENISGLSEEDGDFSVEMIPEIQAAVVAFTESTDTEEIVKKLNQSQRVKKQNITARCLELTKSVRAENIPPNTPSDYITIYFESKKNGGAQVMDVQQLHDEGAAIITFSDHKDVNNVLAKQHLLNKTPIPVYPYYVSLGTALYGKEGPPIKMPDPVTVPLDPYICQFLWRKNGLTEAISSELASYNCEITWPKPSCAEPEVILKLSSATLSESKRSVARLIRTWNETVSAAFSHSISKYVAIKYQVSAEVWEAIKNSFVHDELVLIPGVSKDLLVLVGDKDVLKDVEQELKLLIEKATREIERQKQRTEEILLIHPGDFAILQSTGLEEKIHMEFPALQITYDSMQKLINLCGVPEDVYKVKGEILVNMNKMARKTISIHPYIFQFLQSVDNETLSQSLFMSKQISAFYELDRDAVILKANGAETLLKAEEEIKKELDYKSIALEDESVIEKKEWKMLTQQNCSNEAVVVTQRGSEIVVAGCSQAVAKAFEELFGFIDENTQVVKVIRGKPTVVIIYFEKEKTSVWDDLKKKGVKVDFGVQEKRRFISLSGPRREVLKGATLVEQILSSLHYKRVVINEPGAKSYFKEREHFFVACLKQEFNCLIKVEEEPEEHLEEQQEHNNVGKPHMQVTMGGVSIAVYQANLCTHHVDVVVNASNEDLKHIGGLAEALLQAAGPELQTRCDELVRNYGRLQPGCAVITGAGKLPCKNIIHAVGPRWSSDEAGKCVYLLKEAVKKSLRLAETYNHHSIAFPTVSGGIFGFPLQKCADSIVLSIKETLEESRGESSLKEIHLVDITADKVQAFTEALKKVFSDYEPSSRSVRQTKTVRQPTKRKTQASMSFTSVATKEGLNIMLKKGSIEDATTDAVVVSVARDLQLNNGPLGKALLSKAGPMLQEHLRGEGLQKTADEGSVFTTKGYNLECKFVFHAVAPGWSQRTASPKTVLGNIITECLQIAEEQSLKSITFPAIGTGNLGFPRSVVAKLLFDKVVEFSSKNKVNSLKEVHFLLHPKDKENIQEFSDEFENRCGNNVDKTAPEETSQGTAFFGPISTPAQDVYEMTIGSIVFQVAAGDITKEKGDVIVNVTNQSFSLKAGVSKAILEGAGKAVEDECAQLALQPNNGYITTQAGSLPCKKIIHVVGQENIKVLVSKVLRECELQKYASVSFPAIGTGQAGCLPDVSADEMMNAVIDFAKKNTAPSVKTVKVVIFQPHMLSVFHTSMKKRESPSKTKSKSFFSKLASLLSSEKQSPKGKHKLVLEKKIDQAVVQICGEDKKKVEETEAWLKSAILKEQFRTEIVSDSILDFGEAEHEELCDLQKRRNIALHLTSNIIQISGVSKDVWFAYSSIQDMIHRVKAAKQEEIKAQLLKNLIEWKYLENDCYVPFDKLTNMHLENAFEEKKKEISVTIQKKKYTVNIAGKYAIDDQGQHISIIRINKSEDQETTVLPETWDDMQNQQLKVVELKPETKEYKEVAERFLKTTQLLKIEKIERIQNPFLWKTYQIKKRQMAEKNVNGENEKLLFHGTSKESVTLINNTGFNRSYAGMHAANFGNGTYFAVNACYSAHDTYSKPDVDGKKYMYMARVLVGEYSQGKRGSIIPAPKSASNSTDLFDSSTDNVNNPSMFIIFNDIQAYPEYLITFTR